MTRQTNPDFLNGVPELLVLQLLTRRAMYGYELLRAIERTSGSTLEFGEGCIYPILHRLEKEGHLASARETVAGRSRVVYRLTASGRKRVRGRIATWQSIVTAVNQVLQDANDGRPAVT
jgi:PadR family transcriptional regulator, regulatory protein PadR